MQDNTKMESDLDKVIITGVEQNEEVIIDNRVPRVFLIDILQPIVVLKDVLQPIVLIEKCEWLNEF